ncbi:MAG: hypothetical protein KDA21_10330, partial [Phycisphaerales bacterium]|nr:hypothetical protein [Phycisphaerales bacterium]
MTGARYRLLTPTPAAGRAGSGAIAVIHLRCARGADVTALIGREIGIGDVVLADLFGVDEGLVARWS